MKKYFINEAKFPIVISPSSNDLDLLAWAKTSQEDIRELLNEYGAILFRGFQVSNVNDFETFSSVASGGDWVEYREASTPRSKIQGNVFTSTSYDKNSIIFQHNENSHTTSWPLNIFFYCKTPSESGGETPITDCRKVYNDIPQDVKLEFENKHILYVRKFGYGMGIPWKKGFNVSNKNEMIEYCNKNLMTAVWSDEKNEDKLEISYKRSASLLHPVTNEHVWFNHGTFFNNQMMDENVRKILIKTFGEENLPYNTYYGDGSAISVNTIAYLRDAYQKNTIKFSYNKNDILMLDNMLVAHGREPYKGEREVCVTMTNNIDRSQF